MKILKCFLLVLAFTTFAYGQADTIHIEWTHKSIGDNIVKLSGVLE